jgi:fructose-bisphosphate aldolase class II
LGLAFVRHLVAAGVEQINGQTDIALNLDHGLTFEECKACIDGGFSAVMIDGSSLNFHDNIALTKKVAEYAHAHGVSVEGELGLLSGQEDDVRHTKSLYTDPDAAKEFVEKTSVDCLAVSVGTSHGLVKIRSQHDGAPAGFRFDILRQIQANLPGLPVVLHGASCLYPKYIETVNRFGGNVLEAHGIPEEQVIRAAKETAVCKINIASDGWIAATAAVRCSLAVNDASIDPRVFLRAAKAEMKELYRHKMSVVMGSSGKAGHGANAS